MISLGPVDRFVAGAIGEPGDRTFFFEVAAGGSVHRFLVEKQQVAALAERSLELIRTLFPDRTPVAPIDATLDQGVEPRFRVGEIGIAHRPDEPGFTLVLRPTEEDGDAIEFEVSAEQLEGAALAAEKVVAAGRPLCPRCSLPIDRDGHVCPASNGDLRTARR